MTFSAVLKGLFTATFSKCGTTLVSISQICEWGLNVYISTWLFVIVDTSWWLRNISVRSRVAVIGSYRDPLCTTEGCEWLASSSDIISG